MYDTTPPMLQPVAGFARHTHAFKAPTAIAATPKQPPAPPIRFHGGPFPLLAWAKSPVSSAILVPDSGAFRCVAAASESCRQGVRVLVLTTDGVSPPPRALYSRACRACQSCRACHCYCLLCPVSVFPWMVCVHLCSPVPAACLRTEPTCKPVDGMPVAVPLPLPVRSPWSLTSSRTAAGAATACCCWPRRCLHDSFDQLLMQLEEIRRLPWANRTKVRRGGRARAHLLGGRARVPPHHSMAVPEAGCAHQCVRRWPDLPQLTTRAASVQHACMRRLRLGRARTLCKVATGN